MRDHAWSPTFRIGSILAGIGVVLGALLLFQQGGRLVLGPVAFWLGLVGGILVGLAASWSAHGVAVMRANRETSAEVRHGR